jgi:hypothetical protein
MDQWNSKGLQDNMLLLDSISPANELDKLEQKDPSCSLYDNHEGTRKLVFLSHSVQAYQNRRRT